MGVLFFSGWLLFSILGWLIFSILAGIVASDKGRSGIGFFFLSFFLSPLIGLIAAVCVGRNTDIIEKRGLLSGSLRKCPFCAELVKPEAKICRYCQKELPKKDEFRPSGWEKIYKECPKCGEWRVPKDHVFCGKCDYDFRPPEEK